MSDMKTQQYRPSRRSWIKLWVSEWLDGTVRWQLTQQQRSIWTDLLALAGHSRYPGIITPGTDGNGFVAYPMGHLAGVFRCTEAEAEETLRLLESQGRIEKDKVGVIRIINWDKYQSEYQQKRQRTRYAKTAESAKIVRKMSGKKSAVEVEGEVDVEVEREAEGINATAAAWTSLNFDRPFGHTPFRNIWLKRYAAWEKDDHRGWMTDLMENTINECQSLRIKVPPQFFDAKREVEAREMASLPKRVPL